MKSACAVVLVNFLIPFVVGGVPALQSRGTECSVNQRVNAAVPGSAHLAALCCGPVTHPTLACFGQGQPVGTVLLKHL